MDEKESDGDLKDHYVGYPCVLVRLSRVHPDALRELTSPGVVKRVRARVELI